MRELRRRLLGELLRVTFELPPEDVRIYTLASPRWRIAGSRLHTLQPRKLIESLRTNLNKCGLANLDGWSIAFFHNELDRTTDTYQPHFHVIVVGDKYRAFEALRDLLLFKGGRGSAVYRPVQCDEVRNRARQISYLFKHYWLQTTSRPDAETGGTRRNEPRRLREPRHAESLLFLDCQRFSDLVWMHGIRIEDGRLVPGGGR